MSKKATISELGEFGLIKRLTSQLKFKNTETVKGPGDDCGVIQRHNMLEVVTTDSLVEGIHFDLMYYPLKHLGYKSVIVNLSDVYAMNATPRQITVSMALSSKFTLEAVEEIYRGIHLAAERYKVDIIGGDITSSNKGLFINITAIGTVSPEKITYRIGARPGDLVCVTGDLGAAYLGLQLLEREKQVYLSQPDVQPDLENEAYVLERQLKPEAAREIIQLLDKAEVIPTAMIDISDGLASDLLHICKASDVGMLIRESQVPIRPECEMLALKFKLDPITCALSGGEDYELLMTIDPGDFKKLRELPGFFVIGEVIEKEKGAILETSSGLHHRITAQGWNHFPPDESE